VLERIRGTKNVEAEFLDMEDAVRASQQGNWRKLFTRAYSPQLTCAVVIPFFQQFTGINAIMFYAPQIFNSLGSGRSASLLSAVIIGAINAASTLIAIFTVDRCGNMPMLSRPAPAVPLPETEYAPSAEATLQAGASDVGKPEVPGHGSLHGV
jgi:hypothetical protein